MSSLPSISQESFATSVQAFAPERLSATTLAALFAHYEELRRWNEGVSLIGPGTKDEVVGRHYGESLAALPLLPSTVRQGLDLGSGAGFPGFVIAAARPSIAMTLVEARQKKWAFLRVAARRAALPCSCLNVRVAEPLPPGLPEQFELLTVRALHLGSKVLGALAERLTPDGVALFWVGENEPSLPTGLAPTRSLPLAGSERRRILEVRRTEPR